MKVFQSQSNFSQDKFSCLDWKVWVILYQGKQIVLIVLVNKNTFLFIVVDMRSKARTVSKLVFKLLREFEYRLGGWFQDKRSTLATRYICHPISNEFS
jgi:hypothetical protein